MTYFQKIYLELFIFLDPYFLVLHINQNKMHEQEKKIGPKINLIQEVFSKKNTIPMLGGFAQIFLIFV